MSAPIRTLARTAAPGFFVRWGLLAAWATLAAGCASRGGSGEPWIARVDGRPIPVSQWELERRFTGAADRDGARALDHLIDGDLILEQGRRLGLVFGPQERARALQDAMEGTDPGILAAALKGLGVTLVQWQDRVARSAQEQAIVERVLDGRVSVGRQEMLDRYWDHLLLYRAPTRRVLRQIYTLRRRDAERAEAALDRGMPFPAAAARFGEGPEADRGGLLGEVARGELPKSLNRAASRLKPGTRSRILASHWGYHILYCDAVLPAEPDDPDLEAARVEFDVRLAKEQKAYRAWLARLLESADVERAPGAPAPEQGNP